MRMIETFTSPAVDAAAVETHLREDLAQGDAMLSSVGPILRHLLINDDNSLFSEEVLARLRGMLTDLARQLLDELAVQSGPDAARDHASDAIGGLAAMLGNQAPLLAHVHCVALEAQLTERLQAQLALDPVLSPLLQALIASSQPVMAAEAMALLAAQARFVQAMRRMQLPLIELPGDLLHAALLSLRHFAGDTTDKQATAAKAEAALRARYDESRTRLGQIARIVTGLGGGASAALGIGHAGVAIFLTALGLASGQDRDLAVLASGEGQLTRFLLALRAAGLKPEAVEEQFFALHPDAQLPPGFAMLGADRAASILARSAAWPGS